MTPDHPGYSVYIRESEKVRRKTYEMQADKMKGTEVLCDLWGYFYQYWMEQPEYNDRSEAMLPIFEAWCDAGASIVAAGHGFYKTAIGVLRSILELSLSAVYFDNDHSRLVAYKEAPRWSDLSKTVFGLTVFADYREFLTERGWKRLREIIDREWVTENLYRDPLSDCVHSHVGRWSFADWGLDVVPDYNEGIFLQWWRYFGVVNRSCLFWLLLYFCDVVRLIEETAPEALTIFTPSQRKYLTQGLRKNEKSTG